MLVLGICEFESCVVDSSRIDLDRLLSIKPGSVIGFDYGARPAISWLRSEVHYDNLAGMISEE